MKCRQPVSQNDNMTDRASDVRKTILKLPAKKRRLCRKDWIVYCVCALVSFVIYVNSLNGDFVHDDISAVKRNPDVAGNTSSVIDVFRNDFWGKKMSDPDSHKSYRPLTTLTFRFNVVLAGGQLDASSFHLVNVLLHSTVTTLLVYLCRRVLFWTHQMSLVAGLLFASHPIHTEAVAGIVGRADVLAAIFFILSFLSYVQCFDCHYHCRKSNNIILLGLDVRWWCPLLLSVVLSGLAMLAKEQGITVAAVCIVFDVHKHFHIIKRCVVHRRLFQSGQNVIIRIFSTIILVSILLWFRMWMLNGQVPRFSIQDNPASFTPDLTTRFRTYTYLLARNAWLLLCPHKLSYDWQMNSIPLVHDWYDVRNLATVALAVVLIGLFIYTCFSSDDEDFYENSGKLAMCLGLSFLVFPFLPATNLFFRVGFVMAERVLYIPSIGYSLIVAYCIGYSLRVRPQLKRVVWPFTLSVIVVWSAKTVHRNNDWLSRESLFRSGLETLPHNAKMHYNYGNLQKDLGNFDSAIHHYNEALKLWPLHASAHNNLGTLLGNQSEAEFHFLQAITINPQHVHAYFNLANILSRRSENQMAIALLEHAVELDQSFVDAEVNLAELYSEAGRTADAETLHLRLVQQQPQEPDHFNNYGAFLQKSGRDNEALRFYQKAISLEPNHTVALVNAAKLLRTMQNDAQAEHLYKRALVLEDDPQILDNLGTLYLNTGRLMEARYVFEQINTRYQYGHLEAKVHLAQVQIKENNYFEAETTLLSVLNINRTHREALRQTANLYSRLNKTSEALGYILRALRLCSTDDVSCAQLHADHGNILKDLNDMETAATSYKMAVMLNPGLSHAHLNLGVIYHLKRDYDSAWKYYRAAQILEPHNQLLLDNIEKLRRAELRMARFSSRVGVPDACS